VLDIRDKSYVYRNLTYNTDPNNKMNGICNYYQIGPRIDIVVYARLLLIDKFMDLAISEFEIEH